MITDQNTHIGIVEAARTIGVQVQTLRNWRTDQRTDRPQATKVGHAIWYDRAEVEQFALTYAENR